MGVGYACFECAATGRKEHVPTSADYPDSVVRRDSFVAGGEHCWRISMLRTPRATPAPWKIVVITGAPSWAEYWAPVMAALPQDREMVVVDPPGYASSEPAEPVVDIGVQAQALGPVLAAAPGQKVLLVGQSYGAAIAAMMAAAQPQRVAGLVLLSGYFGELGPTARWLVDMGARTLKVLPRDLRNAIQEVVGQPAQLDRARAALASLRTPIHMVHGDRDDFAPIEMAERLAAETLTRTPIRFHRVADADHFINDGPAEQLLAALEACLPVKAQPRFAWDDLWKAIGRLRPLGTAPQTARA
jgi:pimeloyl-ACP methyl ester carboxylesterase